MRLWKFSIAALMLAASAFADSPQIDSEAVRRVAVHIGCRCGTCKETAACPMSMQGCGFCVPAKLKIVKMQKAGFSDQAIIDSFIKEYGPDIYREGPNQYFWLIPYGSLLLGAGAIVWFVRRYYKKPAAQPAPVASTDAEYARYRDAIEKEVGKLEL
jgi:cytochrome c-type biogenesis protein CcmH/NrfF